MMNQKEARNINRLLGKFQRMQKETERSLQSITPESDYIDCLEKITDAVINISYYHGKICQEAYRCLEDFSHGKESILEKITKKIKEVILRCNSYIVQWKN